MEIVSLDSNSFHLFLTATIGGRVEDILIDTGASRTVFDLSHLVEEPLSEEFSLQTAGIGAESLPISFGCLPELLLGNWEIKNLKVAAMDFSRINDWYARFTSRRIAALIGSDFLLAHKAVIDYGKRRVTFSVPLSQIRRPISDAAVP